jgi:hypothetical protein
VNHWIARWRSLRPQWEWLEAAGLVVISVGLGLFLLPLGVIAGGLTLVAIGVALGKVK